MSGLKITKLYFLFQLIGAFTILQNQSFNFTCDQIITVLAHNTNYFLMLSKHNLPQSTFFLNTDISIELISANDKFSVYLSL